MLDDADDKQALQEGVAVLKKLIDNIQKIKETTQQTVNA